MHFVPNIWARTQAQDIVAYTNQPSELTAKSNICAHETVVALEPKGVQAFSFQLEMPSEVV